MYGCCVLLCTHKSGAGREIQQQYSSSTSRGECCRRTQFFFFYSRVTPWGGTVTNVPIKMYWCCVLLCETNKSGGGRATAGERRRASDVCAHSKYSSSSIVVVRVGRSVVGVHKISFFIHESHSGLVLLLMYQRKCTAVYCGEQPTRVRWRTSDDGRARK